MIGFGRLPLRCFNKSEFPSAAPNPIIPAILQASWVQTPSLTNSEFANQRQQERGLYAIAG
jgi:hypothetical protein